MSDSLPVDNRSKCRRCQEYLNDGDMVYKESFGFWDAEDDEFEKEEPENREYCQDCWNRIGPKRQGTKFSINSGEDLYELLRSSEGQIVADFVPVVLGARPFVRVVEETVEIVTSTLREQGDVITTQFKFTTEDKSFFPEFFEPESSRGARFVYLRNVENTPFGEFRDADTSEIPSLEQYETQ